MENNAYIERIHRYLAEAMNDAEKTEFEQEMSTNGELAEAVKTEEKLLLGIALVGDDALKKVIANTDERLAGQQFFEKGKIVSLSSSSNSFIMKKMLSIAAAAVVLFGLVWWGFFRQGPSTPDADQLFADHFKPETTKSTAIADALTNSGMVDTMDTQDSLREALVLYNKGQYKDASVALDSFLVYHPTNDTAQFYLAMSHLNDSRYARALELLDPITRSETSPFKLDALWYLGLCYFKVDGGFTKAEEIFTQLASNPESKDQQSAKGILHLIGH